MSGGALLKECKKFFGAKSLYELFKLPKGKESSDAEIKKAYYKLSLSVHPDRCDVDEKKNATVKFQIVNKAYAVLSSKEEREFYDRTGSISEDGVLSGDTDWFRYWDSKKFTSRDLDDFKKSFIGSSEERQDLKKNYLRYEGDMDRIMDCVLFATSSYEKRYRKILDEMIAAGEIPSYDIYANEPERKRLLRKKREEREHKMFEEERAGGSRDQSLVEAIQARSRMSNLIEELERKYAPTEHTGARKGTASTSAVDKFNGRAVKTAALKDKPDRGRIRKRKRSEIPENRSTSSSSEVKLKIGKTARGRK